MLPFDYERADSIDGASTSASDRTGHQMPGQFLAGGTNLLDLMKLGGVAPSRLIDINDLADDLGTIDVDGEFVRIGSLVRMSEAAESPSITLEFPVISDSLRMAASPQLRNMASLGGNVLQRTRCQYFRDPSWSSCNKRIPGSGCAALEGVNRKHAVLGISDKCIATYPGDFGTAMAAFGARVETMGAAGRRTIDFEKLHLGASDTKAPATETVLQPGELITHFIVPRGPWSRRSLYLKIRDRQSYEFALTSAAVAIELRDGSVTSARIGLGGVAYKPWRSHEAEASLMGKPLNEETARTAAQAAFAGANAREHNGFKIALGQRTLARALLEAATLEV